MSTLACTLATDRGLDIVTSDGPVHHTLATSDADAVYDALIHPGSQRQAPDLVETTDEIVHPRMASE